MRLLGVFFVFLGWAMTLLLGMGALALAFQNKPVALDTFGMFLLVGAVSIFVTRKVFE